MSENYTDTGKTGADFAEGQVVRYIPLHAKGDPCHPDCETGIVKSIKHNTVFVQYRRQGVLQETAEGTDADNLIPEGK